MRARFIPPPRSAFVDFRSRSEKRIERAALTISDRQARFALTEVRNDMRAAGLGRLDRVIAWGSDKKKARIKRRGDGSFSASGWIFIRNRRNERTAGAIKSATEGADITSKKPGGWLWMVGRDLKRRVGRKRMTPAEYIAAGMEDRIGPLVFVHGLNPRYALLVVEGVSVSRTGKAGSVRRVGKTGRVAKTREKRDFIVAFVGVRRVTRRKVVDPERRFRAAQAAAQRMVRERLRRGR